MNELQENSVQEDAEPFKSLSLIHYENFTNCQQGKLLILDLDGTLCDFEEVTVLEMSNQSKKNSTLLRPYLHQFLKAVLEYYDIALWSATDLETIKFKMEFLDIFENENFKINFVLDDTGMEFIDPTNELEGWAKPLRVIWEKYPNYNETNTIIIDDQLDNFHFNPRNGFLITEYSRSDHDVDDELKHLAPYLIKLAKNSVNFIDVDHSNYKK